MCSALDAEEEAATLWDQVAFYKSNYLATNSLRTYYTGVRAFVVFMTYFGLGLMLPVTDEHLCAFIVYLARSLTMSSIKVYLCGVRAWHLASGFDFPLLSSRFSVFQTLQGVKRFVNTEAKPKMALTYDRLSQLFGYLSQPWTDPLQCAVWTCMLVAYYGMFRKDNVTVKRADAFNPYHSLTRGDLKISTAEDGREVLWVRVRRSKTNQFKERVHYVGLVAVPGSFMCPVTMWRRHILVNPASEDDPAFCYGGGRGARTTPLTHEVLVKTLKALCEMAGMDPTQYSGHSFRRGGATDAFRLKAPHDTIQLQGDWLSTAFLLYHEKDAAFRLQLPSMMAAAVQEYVGAWSPPQ